MFCGSPGACSWISTLSKMFAVLSRRNPSVVFSPAECLLCSCFSPLARPRCFILSAHAPFYLDFQITWGGGGGGAFIHKQFFTYSILQIISQIQCGGYEENNCGFQQYTNPYRLYCVYIMSMAVSTVLPLLIKIHWGLEYNTNTLWFICIYISGLPQKINKSVRFIKQFKHFCIIYEHI